MKYIISIIVVFSLFGITFTSCSYLDEVPGEYLTPEMIFVDDKWAESALRACYKDIPNGFNRYGGNFMAAAVDDAAAVIENASVTYIARALLSLARPGEGAWASNYEGIRRTIFFELHIDKLTRIPLFTDQQVEDRKKRWIAEAKTLRALYYFELIKRYGGVPLVKTIIDDNHAKQVSRDEFSVCVEYIVELCDAAVPDLQDVSAFGRMSKGAALAIKAKTLAYAASALFNNDVTDPILGYTSGTQIDRADRAAQALAAVINAENGAERRYKLIRDFSKIAIDVAATNTEVIFANPNTLNSTLEYLLYPPTKEGDGNTFPSQNLVDAFGYTLQGQDLSNPYLNRDPRFGMTVLYDGATLGARGPIYTREGKTDDANNKVPKFSTNTGFYIRKFLDPNIDLTVTNVSQTTRLFPIIRLADILLLYAEMANMAYGVNGDPQGLGITALDAINQVRRRTSVGMPDISATSPEDLAVKIKNERRVELAFEDQRYFDLRRWKDAEVELNKPLRGVNVKDTQGTLSYNPIIVDDKRKFETYMYLSPIPYIEVASNANLVQNPGWN